MFPKCGDHPPLDRTSRDCDSQLRNLWMFNITIICNQLENLLMSKENKKNWESRQHWFKVYPPSPAGSADWDSHPVVASKAVQLVQLVCSVARPSSHLSAIKKKYHSPSLFHARTRKTLEDGGGTWLWRWAPPCSWCRRSGTGGRPRRGTSEARRLISKQLGKGPATKSDEFLEKFQTAFDPLVSCPTRWNLVGGGDPI